jgi:aminoglycoside/choline kinase family phosphotransferase
MQAHLNSVGIEVPLVIEVHPEQGWVLLEDLGDITLLKKLQDLANPERERFLFERVIDCLVRLQYLASPQKKPAEIEAYRLSFDFEKLMWEVNFTIEHFYLQHLKRVFSATDEQKLRSGLSEICQILASEEKVLTHRDFHSRNVMVAPGDRLVMIDFQDARLGPAQYDLASLLRDSYYQIEEAQIDRLVDYYIAKWEAVSGNFVDRNHFRRVFDLMSVQRNFKAIGSFASFSNLRNNSQYLKYIGNTFENIRRTLTKYPEFHDLREVLTNYYYF